MMLRPDYSKNIFINLSFMINRFNTLLFFSFFRSIVLFASENGKFFFFMNKRYVKVEVYYQLLKLPFNDDLNIADLFIIILLNIIS